MTASTLTAATFANRREAGRRLADSLRLYASRAHLAVLALSRGGVPVGYPVARSLGAPLDIFIVRNLFVPQRPELELGAVTGDGTLVLEHNVQSVAGLSDQELDRLRRDQQAEIHRYEESLRGGHPRVEVTGRTVILVDDGLSSGSLVRDAVKAIRQKHPARIVVAVPVGIRESCEDVERLADELVCLQSCEGFATTGECYEDFAMISDDEIVRLINDLQAPSPVRPGDEEC